MQTMPERGFTRRKPKSPDGLNYGNTNMLIPDTEESLLKYLNYLNKAREKEKLEQSSEKKKKEKSQNKFTLKNHKGEPPPNPFVKKRVPPLKLTYPDQRLTNAKNPIVPLKQKQDKDQNRQRLKPTAQRSPPLRSPMHSLMNRNPKPISFNLEFDVDKTAKNPHKFQPPRSQKTVNVPPKAKPKRVRVTCKKLCRRQSSSPKMPIKNKSPPTEVSKWYPLSVNGLTKPYYEAWLDTEPSPAVFYPSNNDIFKVRRNEGVTPTWAENSWGTIKVRR